MLKDLDLKMDANELEGRLRSRPDYVAKQFGARGDLTMEDDEDQGASDDKEDTKDGLYKPTLEDLDESEEEEEDGMVLKEVDDLMADANPNPTHDCDTDDDRDTPDDTMHLRAQLAAKFKADYLKLELSERHTFDQSRLHFLILLSIDPSIVWTGADVKANIESAVVERGIRSLLAQRLGQSNTVFKISPHIEYNLLGSAGDDIRKNTKKRKLRSLEAIFRNCPIIIPK